MLRGLGNVSVAECKPYDLNDSMANSRKQKLDNIRDPHDISDWASRYDILLSQSSADC